MSSENKYMQQVMAEQAEVEADLRRAKRGPMKSAPAPQAALAGAVGNRMQATTTDNGPDTPAVEIRITGWWRWQNVIVPPNAYVVHTRRGQKEPLHIGLGESFRFNPVKDSFLVVPAAMQTIIINANCICKEKQGILVQGYVQWVIDDFKTAYRRLDFSDTVDPMRVVNVQLREQAEAVIKDTVATMTLENTLSDRQPIIKELTARLRKIMEGEGEKEGMGLRIVTVQIKEAIVSSSNLWETLQRPFRAERAKEARLAELTQEAVVRDREAEEQQAAESTRITTEANIRRKQQEAEAASFDRAQKEKARRAKLEAEALKQSIEDEKEKLSTATQLDELRVRNELKIHELRLAAQHSQAEKEIKLDAARRKVENELSPELLKQRLIDALPEIADRMPKPKEMKTINVNGADGLGTLVPALVELVEKWGESRKKG